MSFDIPADIPHSVPYNAKIYKDECMYSFDTPENNPQGLDIDLKTYQAFARTATKNWTAQNYHKTGNSLYLNINKTLKPLEERNSLLNGERSPKIQKLEVRDINEDELYNTEISIYDAKNDQTIPIHEISQQFQRLVDEILSFNSSTRQDEIKQWEQEIVPCPHSVDLEQLPVTGEIDLTQCTQCDLKENLWICLHCGALGCGREQFGSKLKGNSHALSHYEVSQHPVAIKLGSLSNDPASCDAYCYKCNDEVKVPNLSEKLLKFGIDLKTTVKTEKSLIELNIDQNMNWDFKLDGANGEKLPPVYGKGLTGLQNLGNSCYLNSVIQALFSLDEFKSRFSELKFPQTNDPATDLTTQLIKIHDGLESGRYSKPSPLKDDYQSGIKPSTFKHLIGENHAEFSTQRQQDAHEFLAYLLDKIDTKVGIKFTEPFKFLLADKVVCSSCSSGSLKRELVDNIAVKIDEEVVGTENGKKIYKEFDLSEGFKSLCEPELVEGYSCEQCHATPGGAFKSSGFESFPQNLIVQAQRIKLENWVPVKIDTPVKIPYTLDLTDLKSKGFGPGESELPATEETDTPTFSPNPEIMSMLLSSGIGEARCHKGLYYTGNNSFEEALNWVLEHCDDQGIDDPFVVPETTEVAGPSDEQIENLSAMGFAPQLSKKALILNGNDANAAVEWLFSNPDDDGVIQENTTVDTKKEKKDLTSKILADPSTNGNYVLQAVICHKGTSPHTGHYVVFVKKQIDGEDKWVLFNDEKVVVCDENNLEDMKNNGYIYVLSQAK